MPTRPPARSRPASARQVASLEKEQKARATRYTRDVLDRALVDLLSVYRDALVVHTGAAPTWSTRTAARSVQRVARSMRPEQLLHAMDAIGTARGADRPQRQPAARPRGHGPVLRLPA